MLCNIFNKTFELLKYFNNIVCDFKDNMIYNPKFNY